MNFPEGLKFTKDHEWVRTESDGSVTIGITEFAQSELGEVVFADLPAPGKSVTKSGVLCVVESTKAASDVYAPVSGAVKESNAALANEPALINSDPYGKGWMVKLAPTNPAELDGLLSVDDYRKIVS